MSLGSAIKAFFGNITKYFGGVFSAFLGSTGASNLQSAVVNFIHTDIGAIALDAVEYVHDSFPNLTNVDAREAAKQKLIADAKTAGHDLGILGQSALNLFIELAYQALMAKLTT